MPKLPQYMAQEAPRGIVAPVLPDSPRVGGLVAGVTGANNAIQRMEDLRIAKAERDAEIMAHEAEKIAHEEAQSAVSLTMSAKRAEYTEKIISRQQSGEPLAGMTAQLLKDFDADAEKTIAATPELGRRAMTVRLAELKSHLHERAFGMEADARRAQVVTDFSTGLDADSRVLFADHSQFAPILAARLAAANALVLDPQTKAKVLDNTRESLAYAAGSGLVDKSPDAFLAMTGNAGGKTGKDGKPIPSDPAKAAEAVKGNPLLSNMRPDQLQALTERATMLVVTRQAQQDAEAERARARAEAAAKKAEIEAGRAYTLMRDMVLDGRKIDPADPENRMLLRQMQQVPAYAKAFTSMANDAQANAAAATLPIAAQQAQLNALYAQRNVSGASLGLDEEIKRRERVLTSAQADYKEDPLSAAASRGVIQALAPLDMSTPQSMAAGLAARVQQADLVAQKVGRFVSPFTAAEARKFADDMAKMSTTEKEQRLGTLAQTIGVERMVPTMAQISKDNVRLAVAGGMVGSMTTAGRSVARNILDGDAILKANQFKMPEHAKLLSAFQKQVGDALPTIESRQAAMDAAQAIYAKLRVEDGHSADREFDGAAWRSAVSQVTGGVVDWKGQKILRAKYGASEADTKALLRGVDAAQIKAWGGVAGMSDEEAAQYVREAALESMSVGRYRVKAGASILQRKDGQPFEMVFR